MPLPFDLADSRPGPIDEPGWKAWKQAAGQPPMTTAPFAPKVCSLASLIRCPRSGWSKFFR